MPHLPFQRIQPGKGNAPMSFNTSSIDTSHWAYEEFKNLAIHSGRTIKRLIQTMITLSGKPQASIAGASRDKAEAKAIYRLFENEDVTEEVILQAHRKATIQKMKDSGEAIILCVQDTTTLNYSTHHKTERLGDFGAGLNNKGLLVHSALAVTPNGIALGLLDQHIWTRDFAERGKSRDQDATRQKPIQEKESYKWIRAMDNSQKDIPEGIRLVHVGDREADIYEFFDDATSKQADFLVRVAQNRNIFEDDTKLFDAVKSQPSAGRIVTHIPRDTRRNLPKREATLDIRYDRMGCKLPDILPNDTL